MNRKILSTVTHIKPNTYGWLFAKAFTQVALVAWNVRNIAHGEFGWAFVTGAAISWVWWANSRSAAHDEKPYSRHAYALGAGLGTVFGMWVGGLW